jgi:hypothetical protein
VYLAAFTRTTGDLLQRSLHYRFPDRNLLP